MKNIAAFALSALLLPALAVGQASAAQTTVTLHGSVVDYLAAVGASNGGAIASNPGTGGITVSSHNAGIYTHGANRLVSPLGLNAQGTVYLIDVPKSHGNLVGKIAGRKGHGVTLKGHAIVRDGAHIFVVTSFG